MDSSSKTRKPHQGPCICDDCGKRMQWKGIDWCFTDSGYLLCSSCLLVWVKESRYHKMDKSKQMSMIKILDINAPFIREASSANFEEDLNHEIETKLAGLEVKGLPYERADIIELISSIETEKMRCLEGEISATQLYHYVEHALRTFKLRHPKFHYMEDPAFRLYYS